MVLRLAVLGLPPTNLSGAAPRKRLLSVLDLGLCCHNCGLPPRLTRDDPGLLVALERVDFGPRLPLLRGDPWGLTARTALSAPISALDLALHLA